MTRVILIQPYYENIWEPIGLGFIAGYLKENFVGDIEIVCYQGNFDTDATIIEGSIDADVVGFSCTSPAWPHALRLAEEMKKKNPKIRTIFGGCHPSALPQECTAHPDVDQVVIGEGEEVFL